MSILAEVDVHLDEMVEQVERCFSLYLLQMFLSKGSNILINAVDGPSGKNSKIWSFDLDTYDSLLFAGCEKEADKTSGATIWG